jgi:small subunit ribosomal protein S4
MATAPGKPGSQTMQRRRKPKTRYGYQMAEKQSLKRIFDIGERQLRSYYQEADRAEEATGSSLVSLLERRLDNAVFRAGFAETRPAARQRVSHGLFQVNGRRVTIPSYRLKAGDVVTIKENKRPKAVFKAFPKSLQNTVSPEWITLQPDQFSFKVSQLPKGEEMPLGVDLQAIVEFLAR